VPDFELEREVAQAIGGKRVAVCGIDEVGAGAIAGPIVAGAVVLDPRQAWTSDLRDSKELAPVRRSELASLIAKHALCQAAAMAGPQVIDAKGIAHARLVVMESCFNKIKLQLGDQIKLGAVVDGRFLKKHAARFGGEHSLFIDKADQRSLSVAAASIIAKVWRDNYMIELDARAGPSYEFSDSKGYPTPRHLQLLRLYGPSPFHRRSFGPVRSIIKRGT